MIGETNKLDITVIAEDSDPRGRESLIEKLEEIKHIQEEERLAVLERLGSKISKIRDEAVLARKNSGIERQWQEDEEYNQGIDDKNRSEMQYTKPRTTSGGLDTRSINTSSVECTEFLNITRPFVDAAEARMVDMVRDFSVAPTPVPEFEDHEDDERPMIVDQNGQPYRVKDAIADRNKEAYVIARKAELRIRDHLSQCEFDQEQRKTMAGMVLVGTGILEGPVPKKQTTRVFRDGDLQVTEEIVPASKNISHWDCFPDMNCGEDIQDGEYFIKRGHLTARQLRGLMGMQELGYIDSCIKKVLKEGPNKINSSSNKSTQDSDKFEIWYYYGDVKKKDLSMLDNECTCEDDELDEMVSAIIVVVNDTVIQGHISPLKDYGYPFDFAVWQRVPGKPFGIGVARQGRAAQKTVLAAYRTLMRNQGLSAVPMLAFLREALNPVDGNWELYGGKQFEIIEESGVRNINEAIQTITIQSLQAELTELIQLGMKSMEDSTGITFLMQGQQGAAPDTVGGMQMMLQSASSILRLRVAYFDQVKVKHIKRYYGWLLIYGEDDEKGDLMIDVKGSSSVAEREVQAAQLPQLLQLTMNPVLGKSPAKILDDLFKALKFDPGKFDLDEDEKEKMAGQQPPQDPRIQVAEMQIQKDLQIAEQNAQTKQMQIQKDQDRDAIFHQGVTERTQADRQSHIEELQLKRELELLKYANQNQMQLNDIKTQLAKDALKIQATKELVELEATADRLPKPPIEPAGRAETGRSYQE